MGGRNCSGSPRAGSLQAGVHHHLGRHGLGPALRPNDLQAPTAGSQCEGSSWYEGLQRTQCARGTLGATSSSSVISRLAPSFLHLSARAGRGACDNARRWPCCAPVQTLPQRHSAAARSCGGALPPEACGGEHSDEEAAREVLIPARHALVRAHLRWSARTSTSAWRTAPHAARIRCPPPHHVVSHRGQP